MELLNHHVISLLLKLQHTEVYHCLHAGQGHKTDGQFEDARSVLAFQLHTDYSKQVMACLSRTEMKPLMSPTSVKLFPATA